MTLGKDVIYVNGDSFTEGCDLADHMTTSFKKYYSLHEILTEDLETREASQKAAAEQKFNFYRDPANLELCRQMEQFKIDNRWTSTLSKELNRPVFNVSSHGGSSMYAIIYRTMVDLNKLQKQGYTITDVIIQVTSPSRYSFFSNTKDYEEPQFLVNDYYYHIKTADFTANSELFNLIHSLESYDMAQYRWLHDMCMFKYAIASITNARLILVDSVFYRSNLKGIKDFQFNTSPLLNKNIDDYLLNFKKQLDDEIELSMIECVDLNDSNTMTNSLHFTTKIHDIFAKKIAERYFS